MLSNIENPLPSILDDLEIRSDRLVHQIICKRRRGNNKQIHL